MAKQRATDYSNLGCGCYISHSEIFKDFDNPADFNMKEEAARIAKIVGCDPKSKFVKRMVRLNKFSQQFDVGGWRTRRDGKPAIQKVDKESDGDFYICPYCNSYRFPGEVEKDVGYRYDCCRNGTLRSLIELEKKRKKSPFARYFFGDDRHATLFRSHVKRLNNLFSFTSAGVKPLLNEMKWQQCLKYNATVTFQHCDVYHYLGKNIVPDKKYGSKSKNVNSYAETYMLDENAQLERRIAVGDKSFILKHIKNEEDREIMREIIEDIQKQLLTHNSFVQCFQEYRKENIEEDDKEQEQGTVFFFNKILF